jgi:asparagine synthase (glutamine-hydrolysing)
MGGVLLFGSELKALSAHPAWNAKIDRRALALYLRFGCVPAPLSIYEEIRKVEPATYVTVTADGRETTERYWALDRVISEGTQSPLRGSEREILDELEQSLRSTVRDQMVSDVPLGAFLSGGVDSSTIVALMQAESDRPVRTFTIGFHESAYDEAGHARAVANHLGSDHTEL